MLAVVKLTVLVCVLPDGGFMMLDLISTCFGSTEVLMGWGRLIFETVGCVSVVIACCSIVLGGRLGATRSGSGLVGAFPYWKACPVVPPSHFSPLPVDPTRVTALKFDGEFGALGTRVSELPEVETELFEGTPRKPSSCGWFFTSPMISSTSVPWTIVIGLISGAVVSGIHDSPTGSWSVVDCCW